MDAGSRTPVRGFPRSALLHGTASVLYRGDRKPAPSLPADQSKNIKPKCEKRERGRGRLKTLVNKCFPCIYKTTIEETSASNEDRIDHDSVRCTQDHEKDAYYKHLIANTGRNHCFSKLVYAESINVSLRSAGDELNTVDDLGGQHETLPKVQSTTDGMASAGGHVPDSAETQSVSSHHHSFSKQFELVSEKQENKDEDSNANENDSGTRRRSADTDQENTNGSVADDLKTVLGAVSAQMNSAFGQGNHPRMSVRERYLYSCQQKSRGFQPKELLYFRYAPTLRPNVQMMSSTHNETQRSEQRVEGAEASGVESARIHFSTPVQVSDDQPPMPYQIGDQVQQWEMQASGMDSSQTLAPAYYESLVTNTTSRNAEPEGAAASRQSGRATQGQMSMRGNALNPLGAGPHHHVEHNFGPLPSDFSHEFDQLNIDGRQVSHRPHFAQFGLPMLRFPTFQQGWTPDHLHTPCSLVDAGFFYGGYGDSVLCYSCGIGLRHWVAEDDPWIEHARLKPSCVLVKNIQGQEFIDAAQEMTRNSRKPTYKQVRLEANRRRQAAQAATSASDRGVEDAESALDYDDATTVELLCKTCYRRERSVMLNPCQHLAVCQSCTSYILGCPTCGAHVQHFQAVM